LYIEYNLVGEGIVSK